MKNVNGVSKSEGFSLITMLARAFFLDDFFSSSLSSSHEVASLS
jgi:hypothetical protein